MATESAHTETGDKAFSVGRKKRILVRVNGRVCLSMGIWFPPTTVLLTIFVFCSIVYVSISSFVSVIYGYVTVIKD